MKKTLFEAQHDVGRRKIVTSRYLLVLFFFIATFLSGDLLAQNSQTNSRNLTVKGKIFDTDGEPVTGATVLVRGTTKGAISDVNGDYTLTNVVDGSILDISCIGYLKTDRRVSGTGVKSLNIIMNEDTKSLQEIEVVAFGTQKKESVIGSITTIAPKDLKVPSSNLTTSLAGRMAGIISYQRSGEPGSDDASFFIRGITTFGANTNPLILIDNIELSTTDLARLQPDDIESFSIMKDATATSLYGARGANGVILVKTKQGVAGKAKLNIRIENTISAPTQEVELADPITYMKLYNEAILTRNPLAELKYSQERIDNTVEGSNSLIYPVTDWKSELLKNQTSNQRVNLNISGGGPIARYYVAASFNQDNGLLKVDKNNDFNSNIDLKTYTLRSNVNVNVTKSTELIVRLSGTFDDYNGPIDGGSAMYNKIMQTNPTLFPATYPVDEAHALIKHTMFGNADDGTYLNPYADMVRGYKEYGRSTMSAQFEMNQDLDFITKGLSIRGLFNTARSSYYDLNRQYSPFYYKLIDYNKMTGDYAVDIINATSGTEYLTYNAGGKTIDSNTYIEASSTYNRDFGIHGVSGLLVFQLRNKVMPNAGTLQESLPYRNLGLSGRFTYALNNRYFSEFNFGYNGSERFSQAHRYGFFPSFGLGWMVSNEPFFASLKEDVTKLKFRFSYGLVGNDNISSTRFLYLSDVNMNSTARAASFGTENKYSRNGIAINRYADPNITWEQARKTNFAMELSLWNDLNLTAEFYTEHRTNILQSRASIPYSMGLWSIPQSNLGEAKGHGVDISLDYNKSFSNKMWVQGRANLTYAVNEYSKFEDFDYEKEYWKSKIGYPTSQQWGYIAEGLFVDQEEVENSPTQFGDYMAGDIKYRDMNGDGKITELDKVAIGNPQTPEIVYGFGATVGYAHWDFSFFFQGLANESFWMDYEQVSPFFDTTGSSTKGSNALAKFIADDHWSEETRDGYAIWPRLSESNVTNNDQISTWFMRDGSFLRLKQLELGYSLPEKMLNKAGIKNLRIYLTGNNLLCFSKFKLWDPEMAGNGLGYPVQRVFNVGVNLSF